MYYLLFLLLFLPLAAKEPTCVCTTGEVLVWDRVANLWAGTPKSLYISVISDTQYAYYFVTEPDPSLFKNVGKVVSFCGKVRVAKIVDTQSLSYDTVAYFGSKKQVVKKELVVDTMYRRILSIEDWKLK
jgi:hypothetical protein